MTIRQQEIQNIHKQYPGLYSVTLGLIILIIGFLLGMSLFQGNDNGFSYITNLYTEIFSIGVTVVILDRVNAYRDRQNLKERLIREAKSRSNETAKLAVDWMINEGWLFEKDSLLKGVDLSHANLSGANLRNSNLKDTILFRASLVKTELNDAH